MTSDLNLAGPYYLRYLPVRNWWVFIITCAQIGIGYSIVAIALSWQLHRGVFDLPWQVLGVAVVTGAVWNAFATSPALLTIGKADATKFASVIHEIDDWLKLNGYIQSAATEGIGTYHSTRWLASSAAYRDISGIAVEIAAESIYVRGLPASLYFIQAKLRSVGLLVPKQSESSLFK